MWHTDVIVVLHAGLKWNWKEWAHPYCIHTFLPVTAHSWHTRRHTDDQHSVNTTMSLTSSKTWNCHSDTRGLSGPKHSHALDEHCEHKGCREGQTTDHVSLLSSLVSVSTACNPDLVGQSIVFSLSQAICTSIKAETRRDYCSFIPFYTLSTVKLSFFKHPCAKILVVFFQYNVTVAFVHKHSA